MKVTLKALGFDMSKKEVLDLIKEYDVENSNTIEYADFVEISKLKSDKKICWKRPPRWGQIGL